MNSISLALAGGGARGFVHVGVIKVLLREGIPINEIAGTSMGAIIGASYAIHGDVARPEAFALQASKQGLLRHFDPCMPKHSVIKGEKLRAILVTWFGDAKIEDAKVPLAIVASDLATGRPKVFREGPIVPALMASSAIPGLLPPIKIGSAYYTDGGVTLQLPVPALRSRETLRVGVGLPMFGARKHLDHTPSIVETIILSFSIQGRQSVQDYRRMLRGGVLILPQSGTVGDTLSFSKCAEFIRNGEQAALQRLAEIKERLGI